MPKHWAASHESGPLTRLHAEGVGPRLARPGTYALLFACPRPARPRVGALGRVALEPGYLVYVGSAFGPGGLGGRLRHHLRRCSRPRWHVDHLRPHTRLLGAWCCNGDRDLEHAWAEAFADLPGASRPRLGFGSSDCRCPSHLLHLPRRPGAAAGPRRLRAARRGATLAFLSEDRLQLELA